MASKIFSELKIVELASVLAGPSAGMFFAELGASVVKFENALTQGDVARSWKLSTESPYQISSYFSSINFGKTHTFVDYNSPIDLDVVRKTIAEADVVICNFKDGSAQKFGLDYSTLKQINPTLIYAQLNGFAQEIERVAFDVVLQAECGYMYMNGDKNGLPTKMPLAVMDVMAGHQLKEGILVALWKRSKTKKGSLVTCSLEKSAIASLINQASSYLMTNKIPERIGSLHPSIAPYGEIFTTHDNDLIVLAVGSDKQFDKLCAILKVSLNKDETYKTNVNRVINRHELQQLLQKVIIKWSTKEFVSNCKKYQVPMGVIKNMQQVFESSVAKGMILEEEMEGTITKRVSSVAFEITD